MQEQFYILFMSSKFYVSAEEYGYMASRGDDMSLYAIHVKDISDRESHRSLFNKYNKVFMYDVELRRKLIEVLGPVDYGHLLDLSVSGINGNGVIDFDILSDRIGKDSINKLKTKLVKHKIIKKVRMYKGVIAIKDGILKYIMNPFVAVTGLKINIPNDMIELFINSEWTNTSVIKPARPKKKFFDK